MRADMASYLYHFTEKPTTSMVNLVMALTFTYFRHSEYTTKKLSSKVLKIICFYA